MKEKVKDYFKTANPFLLYIVIYMILFYVIRLIKVNKYFYPSISFDLKIPYIKLFVIPYLSWLIWIPFIWLYTLFNDKKIFKKISYMLMFGMTFYLSLSLIFPTALALRPKVLDDNDLWCKLTIFLYSLSSETYVFPSLHIFHSLVILYAIFQSKGNLLQNMWFRIFGIIWTLLICFSTVFVRQHSVIDVLGGITLFFIIIIGFNIYENTKRNALRK